MGKELPNRQNPPGTVRIDCSLSSLQAACRIAYENMLPARPLKDAAERRGTSMRERLCLNSTVND